LKQLRKKADEAAELRDAAEDDDDGQVQQVDESENEDVEEGELYEDPDTGEMVLGSSVDVRSRDKKKKPKFATAPRERGPRVKRMKVASISRHRMFGTE
jgi:hypothetical protein